MILLNPKKHERAYRDDKSRDVMLKTIEFFENKGRVAIKRDDRDRVWYADFIEFQKDNGIFASLNPTILVGSTQDGAVRTWK